MKRIAIAASLAFIACIVAANYVTTQYGMVPVGFGLTATAGTYLAGLTFVLRDTVQDAIRSSLTQEVRGRGVAGGIVAIHPPRDWYAALPVVALVVVGALLSYLVSDPFIALASGAAFAASEAADLLVYTPLRRRGYIRAAVASNVIGAFVDTVLFLWIAGFPIHDAIAGQMVGKLAVTLVVVLAVAAARTRRAVRV